MSRLTEEMVIARTRQSDLSTIKKLNCWGSELSDVSIIRRMRNVEILALSVNRINTLSDFENCHQLRELYLRKNEIGDINEISYLQNLPELRHLWLEENPCVDKAGTNYRAIILRALPNLKKLDNIEVTEYEVADAQRNVVKREEINYDEQYETQQQIVQDNSQYRNTSSPVRERSPPSQEMYSPQEPNHTTSPRYQNHRGSYHQSDEYYQSDYQKPPQASQYRHSQIDLSGWYEENPDRETSNLNNNNNNSNGNVRKNGDREVPANYNQYRNGSREEWDDERGERRKETKRGFNDTASVVSNAVLNHYASYHRRPVNRSSNLLSATLCLVKELDYPSLEVVEHAVRCRIDELSGE